MVKNVCKTLAAILLLIIQCSVSVRSYSVVHNWSTTLSSDTIANPFAVELSDGSVVFVPIEKDSNDQNVTIEILLKKYSLSGELQANCRIDLDFVISEKLFSKKLISHLEVHAYNGTSVVLSYVEDYIDYRKANLKIQVVDFANCSSRVHTIDINPIVVTDDFDYDNYFATRTYSIVPRGDEIDLFLSSPSYCSKEFCKLTLNEHMEPKKSLFKARAFEKQPKFWEIIAINASNSAEGYYYISRNESEPNPKLRIAKLSSSGSILKLIETDLSFNDEISFSRAYGHLGFCTLTDSRRENLNCILVDSSLNVKMTLNTKTNSDKLLVKNTKKGGLILVKISNQGEMIRVQEVSSDGKLGEEQDFFKFQASKYVGAAPVRHIVSRFMGFTDEKEDKHCVAMQFWIVYLWEEDYLNIPLILKCIKT